MPSTELTIVLKIQPNEIFSHLLVIVHGWVFCPVSLIENCSADTSNHLAPAGFPLPGAFQKLIHKTKVIRFFFSIWLQWYFQEPTWAQSTWNSPGGKWLLAAKCYKKTEAWNVQAMRQIRKKIDLWLLFLQISKEIQNPAAQAYGIKRNMM